MVLTAVGFGLLLLLPTNFTYPVFGAILFLIGVSMGLFASPNRAAVMNALPKADRGAGGAMNQTFQNSAQVLSIGVFFTLMIIGLSATLPHTLSAGLEQHGVDPATAHSVGNLPPVSILFAAFLGYNPIQHLFGPHALAAISAHDRAALTGPTFFPHLISGQGRPARGVHVRDRRLPGRGGRVAAARRADGPRGRARSASTTRRSTMHVEWHGQSAFRLSDGERTVVIDPFDVEALRSRTRWDYPAIDVDADVLLITHEHGDHNAAHVVGGDPATVRSTAGTHASPIGPVVAVASEHDEAAGTQRGPNTLLVFDFGGLRVAHLGDLGQAQLRPEQAVALGTVDLLFVPVGGGPTFDTDQAGGDDGPVVVIPAAPGA